MKKSYLSLICVVAAASLFCWSLGVASDVFRSPFFSSFWWLSYDIAHYAGFVVLTLGGAVLMIGIGLWPFQPSKKLKVETVEE
jgi:hypothetical protein